MASIYELTNALNTLWSLLDEEVVDDEVLIDAFENTKEDLTRSRDSRLSCRMP